jgi:sugar lactone lactonase YvrE
MQCIEMKIDEGNSVNLFNKNIHVAISMVFGVASLLLAANVHAQQVYKWQDEKGAIHYTQSPPNTKNAVRMDIKTRTPTAPAASTTTDSKASSATTTDQAATANKAAKNTPAKLKAEDCAFLKTNLETLQSGRRLYESDDKGERAYLTEEQKAERIQVHTKNIKDGC